MDLNDLDLNLLRVFHQLMIDRRVSAVAESLGMSQPAVSSALKRLRAALRDDLFLRTARGMQPTPLAEQLAEPVASAIETLRGALTQPARFDPATVRRDFVLSLTDIGEIYFLPPLLARLDQLAPGIDLSTARNSVRDLKEEMENGRVDAAIGLLPQLQGRFFRQRLFRQPYVLAMRREHPLLQRRRRVITVADFSAAEHVVVLAAGTGHGQVDRTLERRRIGRRVRLTVPHFVGVGHILESTDLIATLPERMAQRIAKPFGLEYLPHPVKLPEASIDLFWHARMQRDPGHQWLRRQIVELFADRPA
jgi:DNA-binding transcriptional LysR family regulator